MPRRSQWLESQNPRWQPRPDTGCLGRTDPFEGQWPARTDQRLEIEPDRWVQSCCVLCSNGCGLDIGVKEGRSSASAAGPRTASTTAGSGRRDSTAGRPTTAPTVSRARSSATGDDFREASWDEAMDLIVRQAKTVRDPYTSGAIGFYNTGQLFLEEYYTLSMIAQAGLGTSNIDGNTRLCTATAAQALCETFGSDGQPGSYTDVDATDCVSARRHNIAETQTVLWMRVSRPPSRPDAAEAGRHRPADDPDRHGGRRPPRAAPRHERRAAERPPAPPHQGRADRPRVRRPAHRRASTQLAADRARHYPPERVRGDHRRPGATTAGGGPADRHCADAGLDRAPGRLPVEPGDRRGVPGEQPQPRPRHDRQARLRRHPDERPADRAEHPRDRLRRRVPGLPQLAEPALTSPSWPRRLERRRHNAPRLAPPRARDGDLPARRDRLASSSSGSSAPTRPSRCPSCTAFARSSAGAACSSSFRTPS